MNCRSQIANCGFIVGLVNCGLRIIEDFQSFDNPTFCNRQSHNESAICNLRSAMQVLLIALLFAATAWGQPGAKPAAPPTQAADAAPPKDSLGRDTPRGTLVGFMEAARNEDPDVAVRYLNTNQRNAAGARL